MDKKILQVKVSWTENNFGCAWYDEQVGSVVATNKSLDSLKKDFKESLELHINGCVADGDNVPEYLVRGDYELNFELIQPRLSTMRYLIQRLLLLVVLLASTNASYRIMQMGLRKRYGTKGSVL